MTSLLVSSKPFLLSMLMDEVESLFDFATSIAFGEQCLVVVKAVSASTTCSSVATGPPALDVFAMLKIVPAQRVSRVGDGD
jgi:hypothetical protein